MDSSPCLFSLVIIYAATLPLLFEPNPISGHKIVHHHNHHGPLTNVTKHLCFHNFNSFQDIKLLGNARISQQNSAIQIPDASTTVDLTYQVGRAIYSSPIRLFDPVTYTPASFQTTFSFQFTATTNGSNSGQHRRGGNGLAFIFVPDEFTVGRPGPWLGVLNDACNNYYKALAIEFDASYDPEFGDPNDDHVGINLGQAVSIRTTPTSRAGVSLHDGLIHRAWITYDGRRKWIDIYFGIDNGITIPKKPLLSVQLDLSRVMKEYMFVGFSASTGNLTQIHNVLSWNFSSTTNAFIQVPSKSICHRNVAHEVSKYSGIGQRNRPSSFMIFVSVMGLCTLAWLSLYWNSSKQREKSLILILPDKNQKPIPPNKPRPFTIQEIYRATRQFSKEEVLSGDSGGVLYRGTQPNGCKVSIKRFTTRILNDSSRLDRKRVLKEIGAMTTQVSDHPRLATIRGWCCDNRQTIVVCDYFPDGSLDKWLSGFGVLPWTRRFKLIKDVAEALSYLHWNELTHGNVKTSSVFLDAGYRAVLGNYGFTHRRAESGRVNSVPGKSCDLYEFGMLVLEIVAGKRKFEGGGDGEELGLLEFGWRMHERGEMVEMVDKRMGTSANSEQAVRVLLIGLSCSLSDGPSMREVVEFLNMEKPIPKLPPSRPVALSSNNYPV